MRRLLAVAIIATPLAISQLVGCAEAGSGSEPEHPDPQSYTIAGTIKVLPDADNPASELMVAHDEIPEFVGPDGSVVGMRAMTMPFPNIAEDVSLDGLEVGDAVSMTFLVDYSADPIYVVTDLARAPRK